MAATGYRMRYLDADGKEQKISARTIDRMAHVERHAPCGRYEIKKSLGGELWDLHEVRTLEERGIWTVEWIEAGDENHEGAWRILALDEVGRNVLRKWREREAAQK
ncbi:hypothetical protein [Streptomyces niveus]|uniref:hypothetical protein n=1 Tax=Streptomyces niveus TaxID=193462 RepID=UPI00342E1DC6